MKNRKKRLTTILVKVAERFASSRWMVYLKRLRTIRKSCAATMVDWVKMPFLKRRGYTPCYDYENKQFYYKLNCGDNLDEVAEYIRNKPYEISGHYNYQGEKLCPEQTQFSSKRSLVLMSLDDEDAIIISLHNHPSGLRDRGTFAPSVADITQPDHRVTAIVVVGKRFDYVLMPLGDWAPKAEVLKTYELAYAVSQRSYKKLQKMSAQNGGPRFTRGEVVSYYSLQAVAKQFDYLLQFFPAGKKSVSDEVAYVGSLFLLIQKSRETGEDLLADFEQRLDELLRQQTKAEDVS